MAKFEVAETPPVTVGVVHQHLLVRAGISWLLAGDRRIKVVASGSTAGHAVAMARTVRPDVLLFEVGNDVAAVVTESIRIGREAQQVSLVALVVSSSIPAEAPLFKTAFHLSKDLQPSDLIRVVLEAAGARQGAISAQAAQAIKLSQREIQVLQLVAAAHTNREIGALLHLAEPTVKRHTSNIYAKLGAVSRLDAVRRAVALSLLPGTVSVHGRR